MIFFHNRSLKQSLEFCQGVTLIIYGWNKDCSDARVMRCPHVSEYLVTHKYSIFLIRSHIHHSLKHIALKRLFSLVIYGKPKSAVEEIDALTTVVGNDCGGYSLLLKAIKPSDNVLTGERILIRLKSVVNVKG